ncbi:ribosome assembly RNA-binding protein YhbY [bacterium]|nr:ribosome assembly RNA-binding protein YhbY [bacterium]MBR6245722.1 ribosome assembly RNA-binding protein YhbY [bacterium]
MTLAGKEKKYLRGLGHALNPTVLIGKNGLTEAVLAQIDGELEAHELIKIKFIDYIDEKKEIADEIVRALKCECCGSIGHTFLFFRQNANPEKRKITL